GTENKRTAKPMSRTLRCAVLLLSSAATATPAFTAPAAAQSFTVIHDFTGGADGAVPGYTLLNDGNGFIGAANQGGAGYGTVFRLAQKSGTWAVKPLYNFTGDEGQPGWGVIHGSKGSLFVTASYASVMGGPCGRALELDRATAPARPAKLTGTLLHTYVKSDDGCPTGNLLR